MSDVPSLERAIAILRLLDRSRRTISAPEICSELGIPRSTTHRLLQAMVDLELLRRESNGAYATAVGVLSLGFEHLASQTVVDLADPILAELRDQTRWTTHLAVRNKGESIYLLRHLTPTPFAPTISVGASVPLYATVMGRVLLLDHTPEQVNAIYEGQSFKRFTSNTPQTMQDLLSLLNKDRERGYAASEGLFGDVAALAVPVRDLRGQIVAGVSAVAALESQPRFKDEVRELVVLAAARISSLLGYRMERAAIQI